MTRAPGTRLRTAVDTYPARGETRALHVDVWSLCLVCLLVCLPRREGSSQHVPGRLPAGWGVTRRPMVSMPCALACLCVCLIAGARQSARPRHVPACPALVLAHSLTRSLSISLSPATGKRFCMLARTPARTRHAARDMPGPCRGKHVGGAPSPLPCGVCAWCVRVNVCRPVRSSVGAFAVSHARRRGAQAPGELQGLAAGAASRWRGPRERKRRQRRRCAVPFWAVPGS